MNNLTPRQCEIIKLVNQKGELSVTELVQLFEISQATAYREIQDLTQLGLVNKVSGGIIRMELLAQGCVNCGRENNERTTFLIEQVDGVQQMACCAHCGLLVVASQVNISTAMTTDFLYGTLLNASQAWYVINSSISLCCRPSVLTFSNPSDAKRFTDGFGGELLSFSEAQQKVKVARDFKKSIHKN